MRGAHEAADGITDVSSLEFEDDTLSLALARVSEAAARASAGLIGRGDEKAADQAAVNAMRAALGVMDVRGTVVIGEGERDEAPMLFIGEEVGSGKGPEVDIALDPLEGTTLTAKDMPGALTVIAMAPRGALLHAPDVYMEKLAIGPGYAEGVVSLEMTPAERVKALARAKGVKMAEITRQALADGALDAMVDAVFAGAGGHGLVVAEHEDPRGEVAGVEAVAEREDGETGEADPGGAGLHGFSRGGWGP